MIDYDTLKLAHELAEKYSLSNYGESVSISSRISSLFKSAIYTVVIHDLHKEFESFELDDLIDKLRTLTAPEEPKAKYTLGDELWYLHHQEIESFISVKTLGRTHYDGEYWWHEDYLYPTKASLIEAQLEYWQKLKQEDCEHDFNSVFNFYDESGSKYYQGCSKCKLQKPDECQHESDNHSEDVLEKVECSHEPDVRLEAFKTLIGFDKSNGGEWFKCKKCKDFYR